MTHDRTSHHYFSSFFPTSAILHWILTSAKKNSYNQSIMACLDMNNTTNLTAFLLLYEMKQFSLF